jgi:hypothetical protein
MLEVQMLLLLLHLAQADIPPPHDTAQPRDPITDPGEEGEARPIVPPPPDRGCSSAAMVSVLGASTLLLLRRRQAPSPVPA